MVKWTDGTNHRRLLRTYLGRALDCEWHVLRVHACRRFQTVVFRLRLPMWDKTLGPSSTTLPGDRRRRRQRENPSRWTFGFWRPTEFELQTNNVTCAAAEWNEWNLKGPLNVGKVSKLIMALRASCGQEFVFRNNNPPPHTHSGWEVMSRNKPPAFLIEIQHFAFKGCIFPKTTVSVVCVCITSINYIYYIEFNGYFSFFPLI